MKLIKISTILRRSRVTYLTELTSRKTAKQYLNRGGWRSPSHKPSCLCRSQDCQAKLGVPLAVISELMVGKSTIRRPISCSKNVGQPTPRSRAKVVLTLLVECACIWLLSPRQCSRAPLIASTTSIQ
jgi:hypothetical protein